MPPSLGNSSQSCCCLLAVDQINARCITMESSAWSRNSQEETVVHCRWICLTKIFTVLFSPSGFFSIIMPTRLRTKSFCDSCCRTSCLQSCLVASAGHWETSHSKMQTCFQGGRPPYFESSGWILNRILKMIWITLSLHLLPPHVSLFSKKTVAGQLFFWKTDWQSVAASLLRLLLLLRTGSSSSCEGCVSQRVFDSHVLYGLWTYANSVTWHGDRMSSCSNWFYRKSSCRHDTCILHTVYSSLFHRKTTGPSQDHQPFSSKF